MEENFGNLISSESESELYICQSILMETSHQFSQNSLYNQQLQCFLPSKLLSLFFGAFTNL